jgi:hypothetical protein
VARLEEAADLHGAEAEVEAEVEAGAEVEVEVVVDDAFDVVVLMDASRSELPIIDFDVLAGAAFSTTSPLALFWWG